jgi:hypothetical protein
LVDSSLEALKKALSERKSYIRSISIVGCKLRAIDASLGETKLLLRRQAIVAKTIAVLGFDAAHASVPVVETNNPTLDDSVSVVINGI